jgi:PAS domain S-box-containing protein
MAAAGAENSGFFETLLDSIVDAVIIIDGEGRIQRFNRSAQLMFGYAPGEVLQKNVSMLMPAPAMSQHDGYLRRYGETGRAAIIGKGRDERGLRKSGETFPMRLSVGESRHQRPRLASFMTLPTTGYRGKIRPGGDCSMPIACSPSASLPPHVTRSTNR